MPVHKCPNGKYRIGSGKCIYDSKEKAEKAYKAYLAKKHSESKNERTKKQIEDLLSGLNKDLDDLYAIRAALYREKEKIEEANLIPNLKVLRKKLINRLQKVEDYAE